MRRIRALLCGVSLTGTLLLPLLSAQTAPPPSTPTFRVTTRLLFLDVTVLDKKGRPVTKGLTKDDFIITDNKQPQPIVSFEAPDQHVDMSTASENPSGKAPATVLVLDLLNSKATDFSYIRYEVRKFLEAQPGRLSQLSCWYWATCLWKCRRRIRGAKRIRWTPWIMCRLQSRSN